MKYLLIVTDRPNGPFPPDPLALNRAVQEFVSARLADGTMDCAYYLLPRGGMSIINADSHEALLALLRAWPGFGYQEFEVHMLGDIRQAIANNRERLHKEQAQARSGS